MPDQINLDEVNLTEVKRILGKYPKEPHTEGPALIISAGVHGNEPSGLLALKRVFKVLDASQIPCKGQITGVSGNLEAIKNRVRLIDKDLNRVCTLDNEEKIRNGHLPDFHEAKEFKALIEVIDDKLSSEKLTEVLFMDFHTTSSDTTPFISVNKQQKSYDLAIKFPLPVVKGIEKYIPGHFDHYLTLKGHRGFTVEAGQHLSAKSVDYHEAMVWMMLEKAGMVAKKDIPQYGNFLKLLEETFGGESGYEVIHRHHIEEGEEFSMKPGFKNFSKISKGEILATSNGEDIISEIDGRIYMPLYQSQGSDGFFIVKEC